MTGISGEYRVSQYLQLNNVSLLSIQKHISGTEDGSSSINFSNKINPT